MWLTTRLAGPALPSDKWINIIQQAVQTLTTGGILAMGIKVAAGIKWRNARRNKGTTLRGLLDVLDSSAHKAVGNIRRAGSCIEILLYILVLAAGLYHFTLNTGNEATILVPAYPTQALGNFGIPNNSLTALEAQENVVTDSLTQPRNLNEFLDARVTRSEYGYSKYSPALLAAGNYTEDLRASNSTADNTYGHDVREVVHSAILLSGQNLFAFPYVAYTLPSETPLDNQVPNTGCETHQTMLTRSSLPSWTTLFL
ncbi:unnamed protein product [Jaminaea pallidilutea]